MRWRKLGQLFVADNLCEELRTHASTPCAIAIGDHWRVYYSSRDDKQRSSISFVDIAIDGDKVEVIHQCQHPVLTPGQIGAFDDSGVSLACVLKINEQYWLYYLGWNLGVTVPWRNSIGLAISDDGVNFKRLQLAPVLDRNRIDPFSVSYPWVMREGEHWHMWYGSNLKWGESQEDMDHLIKYAHSENGIDWQPTGAISVPFKSDDEYAMSKPCVIKENGVYKMWFSYRGPSYRIGYAESTDGVHFERQDQRVGIDVSPTGWDSQSIEYPFVFDHKQQRYMIYNGNRYGLTGFGIARLETL